VEKLHVFTRDVATGSIALAQTLTDDVDGVDGLWGSISVTASPDGRAVFGQGINDNAISVFDVACANGVVDAAEQCDDDNVTPGDGCDGACQIEAGWACEGAPSACFHDQPISGSKLQLRRTASGKEKAQLASKDPNLSFPVRNGPDDPTVVGATVEWVSPVEGVVAMSLPASHWSANAAGTVYTFKNKTAPDGTSAVKSAQIRQGKGLKISAKLAGLPLAGPHGTVAARVRTGTLRNCAVFGGTIQADVVNRFQAKLADVPSIPDCTVASVVGP
jgi:cysteine-rich repeat protein